MKCRKCKTEIPDESNFCLACGAKQTIQRRTKSRGNGQGSVFKRPNNTWVVVKTVGYKLDDDGKRHRITRSKSGFKTKKEALEYMPRLTGERKVECPTFKAVYDLWLPTHRASKSTLDCYKAAVRYFEPVWYTKLSDITIEDLQECMDDCPKGKRTKQNMRTLCGLVYKYAIPRRMTDINLSEYLIVSGDDGEGKVGLPIEAVKKIQKNIWKCFGADYIVCQCFLGFRPSELLQLNVESYNATEKAFVGGSKTAAGINRTVTISPIIQPIIDTIMDGKSTGPVFCSENGKRMSPSAYRSLFYSVLEKCGIDNPVSIVDGKERKMYTPHSCRHTFATMMKRVEGAEKDKLELIGHTDAEMLRHYQDVNYADLRKITDAISLE